MLVRYRPMEPRDIPACAGIIARHPVLARRYGSAIQQLASAWQKMAGRDGFVAVVFEDVEGTSPEVLGAGISVFVTDEFIRELKTPPHFWIDAELAIRISRGNSPVLSDRQVREANSSCGLNIAVWQPGILPETAAAASDELPNTIMGAFVEMHRGFLVKELVVQAETPHYLQTCRGTGTGFWSARKGKYDEFPHLPAEEVVRKPHVMGMSRELAASSPGAWAALPFLYQPPRFGFSRGEQRLIVCAMAGRTDEDVAQTLGISLTAVRKTWHAIYERVSARWPELLGEHASRLSQERGKQKKHHLLGYVREHPEELRPISRRLFAKVTARNGAKGISQRR